MTLLNHSLDLHALPDNVVAFPGAFRPRAAAGAALAQATSPRAMPRVAVSGSELNARLLILLGICVMSATAILSAVHILQGP